MASVCQSLQCLISALTQAGGGGLLFRFACSVVLWGGRALQTNVTGVCGEHSQCSGYTGFAPLTGVCFPRLHCSGSRLLCMEQALRCVRFQFLGSPQKHGLGWACILCLPRLSSSGSQQLYGRTLLGCRAVIPSTVPTSVSACASWVRAPCVCSRDLASSRDPPADVNHPESQEVFS